MKKILVVDDDVRLREELKTLLVNNGYEVEVLGEFEGGVGGVVSRIAESGADLILLDINLPGISGESLLREVRKVVATPVIMVTSQDNEVDELLSMSFGADDFVAKPYNANILLLRIEAVLRRVSESRGAGQAVRFRGLEYFPEKGEIRGSGEGVQESTDRGVAEEGGNGREKVNEVVLTRNEMMIFNYLLDNKNSIVSRRELMTLLWDNASFLNDSTLSVTISRLRDKLEKLGVSGAIETRKGQGYILEDG